MQLPILSSPFHKPHVLDFKPIPGGLQQICKNIIYRQSMIQQYISCPQQALYDAILHMEESTPFFAAVAGTAGHRVMYHLHESRTTNPSYVDIVAMFTEFFEDELKVIDKLPKTGVNFETLEEQLQDIAPSYAQKIEGYFCHKDNKDFHSTLHEQYFVLLVTVPQDSNDPASHDPRPYVFTGQIDQAGYEGDGTFHMRDIKFRDDAFKPSNIDLRLSVQLTVYAYALRFGTPACGICKPHYDEDMNLIYGGPCDKCKAKIGTSQWPQKYPEKCSIIWMNDFSRRKDDEYKQYIKDPLKKRIINPNTGRPIIRDVVNPNWITGYKTGDYKGKGILTTVRPPSALNVLMSDIIRIAEAIRRGIFYRNPDKSRCNNWCRYKDHCINQYEMEIEANDVSQLTDCGIASDPFGDDS